MNLPSLRIDPTSIVSKLATPRYLKGGPIAVLILHGFGGWTADCDYLAARLNEAGYTVVVPRLPGHGTNATDFDAARAGEWLRHVMDAYMDLKATFETVHIVGHSMGGLLAILLASVFQPAKLVLSGTAIDVHSRIVVLSPLVRLFVKRVPRPPKEPRDDPEEQRLLDEYWAYHRTGPLTEFLRLRRAARRRLRHVLSEVFLIVSKADRTVPVRSLDRLRRGLRAARVTRELVLENSRHRMLNGEEKERVADAIVEWLRI